MSITIFHGGLPRVAFLLRKPVGAMFEPEPEPGRSVAEPNAFLYDLAEPGRDLAAASCPEATLI